MRRMNGFGCLVIGLALLGAAGCSGNASESTDPSGDGGSAPVKLDGVTLVGVSARDASQLVAARPDEKLRPTPTFASPPPVSEYTPASAIPTFSWAFKSGSTNGMRELTYLNFGVPAQKPFLRLVTSETSFTPTKDQWKAMSVGEWVTVDIFSGLFEADAMQGDAAEGDPVQFCSMPATATK
jgi:hypothetical protein